MTTKTLYQACVDSGIPTDNHESDLYIPVTEQTTALLKQYGYRATTFRSQVDGQTWYDVPFMFQPYWDRRAK